jgi:uncharacterized protein (DUF58 family)
MLRNRIIMLLFIVGTAVFASFYGGTISYGMFYLSLLIPVASFIYTLAVYFNFKIYQKLEHRKMLKGELTPYCLTVSNEGILSYVSIKVNLLSDKSYIRGADEEISCMLNPGEKYSFNSELCCRYRGEYDIGVSSVVIKDYLYLFNICYPIRTKLSVTVLPRVFHIDRLVFAVSEQDNKNNGKKRIHDEVELDSEVRKYQRGDSLKLVHWKASAKKHELLSRKYSAVPQNRLILVMDTFYVKENELDRAIIEDMIIESALSIADYCLNVNTPVTVLFGDECCNINNVDDFNVFYDCCAKLSFISPIQADEILNRISDANTTFCIAVTHNITEAFCRAVAEFSSHGNNIGVLYIGDKNTEKLDSIMSTGINIVKAGKNDSVTEILSAK